MSGSSGNPYFGAGRGMHEMTRTLLHIAVLLAFCFGIVTGARAMTLDVALVAAADLRTASASKSSSIAPLEPIYVQSYQYGTPKTRKKGRMIPPSAALQAALRFAPGSQGLGVRLLQGPRLVYAVKVKSGNRIRRILVDARTGRVLGE